MNTTLDTLHEEEAHLQLESCENGHPLEKMKRWLSEPPLTPWITFVKGKMTIIAKVTIYLTCERGTQV